MFENLLMIFANITLVANWDACPNIVSTLDEQKSLLKLVGAVFRKYRCKNWETILKTVGWLEVIMVPSQGSRFALGWAPFILKLHLNLAHNNGGKTPAVTRRSRHSPRPRDAAAKRSRWCNKLDFMCDVISHFAWFYVIMIASLPISLMHVWWLGAAKNCKTPAFI